MFGNCKATVKYDVGTYSGTEIVYCDWDDENETIIAKAKRQVYKGQMQSIGMAYESWKVIERENNDG